jgi:hypothetical protein
VAEELFYRNVKGLFSPLDLRFDRILNGEILEEYPDLGLGESCFILGIAG